MCEKGSPHAFTVVAKRRSEAKANDHVQSDWWCRWYITRGLAEERIKLARTYGIVSRRDEASRRTDCASGLLRGPLFRFPFRS